MYARAHDMHSDAQEGVLSIYILIAEIKPCTRHREKKKRERKRERIIYLHPPLKRREIAQQDTLIK